MKCKEMADEGVEIPVSKYTGQTSRSLYQRGKEHLTGFLKKDENNALYKHSVDKHDGEYVEFEMKVVKQHFSAFSRLVHESVRIKRNYRDSSISVLNSKSEWGSNKLPRLVIEVDENPDNIRGNNEKNDFERLGIRKGSLSGRRQGEFQSSNSSKKLFNSWTPSTGKSADDDFKHRQTQLTMQSYFRDKFK